MPIPRLHAPAALVLAALVNCLAGGPAQAHPHAFAETTIKIVFDSKGLSCVQVRWVFDEMFSALITDEFDADHNGRLSPAEVAGIKKGAFSNLSNFGYFTHIRVRGRDFRIKWVKDFAASIQNHKLIYSFTIPCHVKAGASPAELVISPYDPTYYTAIDLAEKNPVALITTPQVSARFLVETNFEKTIYFGRVNPMDIRVSFWRKR